MNESKYTNAHDEASLQEVLAMKMRLESDNPPSQPEFNRFICQKLERHERNQRANHEIVHSVISAVNDLRNEIKKNTQALRWIAIGATAVWWLSTQTNIKFTKEDAPKPPEVHSAAKP